MYIKSTLAALLTTLLLPLTSALPSADEATTTVAAAEEAKGFWPPHPPSPSLPFGTQPIPFHDLPTSFPPKARPDPVAIESIRNTLALYPFAIDGKNFDALDRVFAGNAAANYSEPLGVLRGLRTIQSTLEASLAPVTTQHNYGTQLIDIVSKNVAVSVTYFRAAHFGMGDLSNEVAYAYGQYQDTWQAQRDGTWKIVYRNLVFMGPLIGNQAVFIPQPQ